MRALPLAMPISRRSTPIGQFCGMFLGHFLLKCHHLQIPREARCEYWRTFVSPAAICHHERWLEISSLNTAFRKSGSWNSRARLFTCRL
jgi:hypothetical protein